MKWLKVTEYIAWAVGFALVGFYVASKSHSASSRASDIERFAEAKAALSESAPETAESIADEPALEPATEPTSPDQGRDLPGVAAFDFSLWAEGRIKKYKETLEMDLGVPMAILRIPDLKLEVPVLEGTDDAVLDRAVGRIAGTVQPGQLGNAGIAGHRDGVFRGLKDLEVGDWLEVETLAGIYSYQIDTISIVSPSEVEVLKPSTEAMITLVTCYPFYFVGKAPQRYIVRALFKDPVGVQTASTDTAVSVE
jgi:sortase A